MWFHLIKIGREISNTSKLIGREYMGFIYQNKMKTSNFIGWESEKILKLWCWLVDINIDTYVQHGGMALENKEQSVRYQK